MFGIMAVILLWSLIIFDDNRDHVEKKIFLGGDRLNSDDDHWETSKITNGSLSWSPTLVLINFYSAFLAIFKLAGSETSRPGLSVLAGSDRLRPTQDIKGHVHNGTDIQVVVRRRSVSIHYWYMSVRFDLWISTHTFRVLIRTGTNWLSGSVPEPSGQCVTACVAV